MDIKEIFEDKIKIEANSEMKKRKTISLKKF